MAVANTHGALTTPKAINSLDTHAQVDSGGLAPTATLTKPARDLHVPAVVLALPLGLTEKLVFAEIIDLHRVAGRVFARDAHFAERLGCGIRTIGSAIAKLESAGYLTRPINPAARQKRTLVPVQKWLLNQQGVVAESATSDCNYGKEWLPNRQGVVAESADINTTLNTTLNTTINPTLTLTTPFGRGEVREEDFRLAEETSESIAEMEGVAEQPKQAPAPKKKVAAKKKPPGRPQRREVLFNESDLASYEAFSTAFATTDYALADLRYYHEKIKNWRQKGEPPRRKDWLATAKQFFLNDAHDNRLKLAPGVEHYSSTTGPGAARTGESATGYRSSRHQ